MIKNAYEKGHDFVYKNDVKIHQQEFCDLFEKVYEGREYDAIIAAIGYGMLKEREHEKYMSKKAGCDNG